MQDGHLFARSGSDVQDRSVRTAISLLAEADLPTATKELAEALKDISRRPDLEVTGAVTHSLAAVEAAARVFTGSDKRLGQLEAELARIGLPKPLDAAAAKAYGYASQLRATHG